MSAFVRRALFGAFAVIILSVSSVMPAPDGLSREGLIVLGLTLFNITLWMGNVVPKPIAGLAVMLLLPQLGIAESLSVVFKSFISPVFFFLMAAFAISAMIKDSDLPSHLMSLFLKIFRNSTKRIILAFMIVSALVSTIISDLAACALMSAVALNVIEAGGKNNHTFDKSFVKSLLIGIPAASLAGGIATPIGSSSNITMLALLTQSGRAEISFLQWMIAGTPIATIATIASWAAIVITFKPAPLDDEKISLLLAVYSGLSKISKKEKKIIVVISGMFTLWICSDMLKQTYGIDSTFIAMVGMVAMFVPGLDLLKWDTYSKEMPWDLVIMLGSLMSLASFMMSTGAVEWVAMTIIGEGNSLSPFVLLLTISIAIAVLRAFIPSGPPIVIMLAPAIVAIAANTEINPLCVILSMSTWVQITYLLPAIDALYLITYSKGYYSIYDVARFGLPLTIILIPLFASLLIPLVDLAMLL